MNKILTALLALGCTGMAYAQEVPAAAEKNAPPKQECRKCDKKDMLRRSEGRRAGRPNMQPGDPMRSMMEADAKIKEKFPAEYAEIQKLRMEAAEKMKAAQEKYFDLAEKAEVKLSGSELRAKMKEFQAKYEKELAEIKKLAETDPKAAGEKMRALWKKEGIRPPMPREGRGLRFDGPRDGKGMNGQQRGHGRRHGEGKRPMPAPEAPAPEAPAPAPEAK